MPRPCTDRQLGSTVGNTVFLQIVDVEAVVTPGRERITGERHVRIREAKQRRTLARSALNGNAFSSHPQIFTFFLCGALGFPGLLGSTKPAGLGSDAAKVMFLMAIPASVRPG